MSIGALELGGSHVAAGRVDLEAGSVAGGRVALPEDASRNELLGRIRKAAELVDGAQRVGVAVPGPFDVLGITLGTGLGSAFITEGVLAPEVELYRLTFRGRPVEETISARGIGGGASIATLASRAREGDDVARAALERAGAHLGEFLLPHVRRLRVDRVVVGGSIARAWKLLEPTLHARVPDAVRAVNLDEAALVGAAYHAS